jgi:hypothetical protein
MNSKLIRAFGIFIMATSIWQLFHSISPWRIYVREVAFLPMWAIQIRFVLSHFIRFFGLCLGWGIFVKDDLTRKLLIGFCWIVLSTLFAKHAILATSAVTSWYHFRHPIVNLPVFIWINYIIYWVPDIIFCVFSILWLRNQKIRNEFKKEKLCSEFGSCLS